MKYNYRRGGQEDKLPQPEHCPKFLKTCAVTCGSIISLLQRRLSELFRRLQKLILQIRETHFLWYSKWELQPRYAAPSALKDLLIPAGNKLSLAEDARENRSDFSCDQESSLWLSIPKGLPAPAHLMFLLPCRADPVPLSPVLTKREDVSILRSGNAPGTALIHHVLQRLTNALGKHGVIWEEDLGVRTGPVKVAVVQLCVLCALKWKIQSKKMQVIFLHREHQQISLT